jgi:RNA polymerase sigma-70 factor (ECF subfamily)
VVTCIHWLNQLIIKTGSLPGTNHSDPVYLFSAFLRGEEEGFDYVFRQYYRALVFFCRRYVGEQAIAEELAADCFMRVWARRAQFYGEASLRAYLYKAAYHNSLKWLQDRARRQRQVLDCAGAEGATEDISHTIIRAETIRLLHAAIAELPPQCRLIFQKLYIEGKTVKETAAVLRLSVSTVHVQKMRGLRVLRDKLGPVLSLGLLCGLCC